MGAGQLSAAEREPCVCESREAAKDAKAELPERLRRKVEHSEQTGLQPATVKALFEHYV